MMSSMLKYWLKFVLIYFIIKLFSWSAFINASINFKSTVKVTENNDKVIRCKDHHVEYNGHCYFLETCCRNGNFDSEDVTATCQYYFSIEKDLHGMENSCNEIPTVKGLAVETFKEFRFIQKFLIFSLISSNVTVKLFTSGYWSCGISENFTSPDETLSCGSWHGWNTPISPGMIGLEFCSMGSDYNCTPSDSSVLYYILKKYLGNTNWSVWVDKKSLEDKIVYYNENKDDFFSPPTHVICEYELDRSCITTNYETTSTEEGSTKTVTSTENWKLTSNHLYTEISEKETPNETNDWTGATNSLNGTITQSTVYNTYYGYSTETTDQPTTGYSSGTTQLPITGTPNSNEIDSTEISETNEATTETTPESCELCKTKDQYGVQWEVCAGDEKNHSCPDNAPGFCSWWCNDDGYFLGVTPNYIECHHEWIEELISMVENHSNAVEIISELHQYTAKGLFFGHEILKIMNLLSDIDKLFQEQVNGTSSVLKNFEMFFSLVGNVSNDIISYEIPWMQIEGVTKAQVGNKLHEFLSEMGFLLLQTANMSEYQKDYSYSSMKIGLQLTSFNKSISQYEIIFPQGTPTNVGSIKIKGIAANRQKKGLFHIAGVGTIYDCAPGKHILPETLKSWKHDDMQLNTAVISFEVKEFSFNINEKSFIYNKNQKLPEVNSVIVELIHSIPARGPTQQLIRRKLFHGEAPTTVIGDVNCVFWNSTYGAGEWDKSGCEVVFTNETFTSCYCSHLSSFAVFMMLHKYEGKEFVMELLSWICSVASIFCLILTLLVFQIFRSQLQGERETICRNICLCLLVTHILTLTVLDKSYFNLSDTVCSYLGALLHYTLSAGIMWMAAEGHHLYRLVLRVMDGTGKDLRLTYCAMAYGLPVLLVGLTAVMGLILGENAYGNPELCWLSLPHFQWSFISQALLITGINTLVLILALKAAVATGSSKEKTTFQKLGIWLRGWFTLSSLLGVTWFLGLAAFDFHIYFEYFFIVFNGSQGLLIFITRILRNEQVRSIVMKKLRKRALLKNFYSNTVSEHSSSFVSGSSKQICKPDITSDQLWNTEDEPNSSSNQTAGTSKTESIGHQMEKGNHKGIPENDGNRKSLILAELQKYLSARYVILSKKYFNSREISTNKDAEEVQEEGFDQKSYCKEQRDPKDFSNHHNNFRLPIGSFSTITEEDFEVERINS